MVTQPGELTVASTALLIRTPEMFNATLLKFPGGGTPRKATATLALVGAAVGLDPPPPPHPEGMIRPHNTIRGGSREKTIHHGCR
jgi:hypothetical protein